MAHLLAQGAKAQLAHEAYDGLAGAKRRMQRFKGFGVRHGDPSSAAMDHRISASGRHPPTSGLPEVGSLTAQVADASG
jgi:hypothetical protein